MKKTLFKTIMGLLILVALLIVFTSNQSFAGSMNSPLCSVMLNRNGDLKLIKDMGGKWTSPILVYSDKDVNVYTGEDTITGNLFWGNLYGDFLGTGNFLAQLYLEIKDKKLRKQIIESLKSDISKQPSLAMIGHPDLFTYVVHYAFFDMKNNIVSLRRWEKFLDRDGDLILVRNAQENIPLDNKSNFKPIANGIIAALNKAKNDPKIADRIREMQRHGKNMTAALSDQTLRNANAARAWKKDPKTGQFIPKDSGGLTVSELYSKINALWDKNNAQYTDPKKAIEYLTEIIRLKPDDAIPYYCRGVAYYCLPQYQQAIKDYDEAIRLKPNYAEPYGNRGLAYSMLGQYQQAIKDYDEAIRLKPNATAFCNRGKAYFSLGQYQQAIKDYDAAIRLEPDSANVYFFRGQAYIYLGQYQQAIKDLDEAIRLKPNFATAYNDRGYAYNGLGQYQQAIKDLNEAIRLKPDFANPYRHRANSSRNLGQYQRAIEDYNEAIRLKPDYADAYNDRGLVYILFGNKQEGCRSLVRACELGNCNGYNLSKQKGDCR